jgi:hypothetical protein
VFEGGNSVPDEISVAEKKNQETGPGEAVRKNPEEETLNKGEEETTEQAFRLSWFLEEEAEAKMKCEGGGA